jgi:uncharacterized protein
MYDLRRATSLKHPRPRASGPRRVALLFGGFAALVLAVIGAILPVMPATPFILLAAYCFARSSSRWHTWLTSNRLFGRYVSHVAQGRPLSWPIKVALIASCWISASLSFVFLSPNLAARLSSLGIAAGMTVYVLLRGRRPTKTAGVERRFFSR